MSKQDYGKWAKGFDRLKFTGNPTPEWIELHELTDEEAEQHGTITCHCVYCNIKTVHKWRRGGDLYCEVCDRRTMDRSLYCPHCRKGTGHYEYHDVWKCVECGNVKSPGQS